MFSQIKINIKKLLEIRCFEYIQQNSIKTYAAVAAAATWCLFVSIIYITLIRPSMPEEIAKDYIGDIISKNYTKVCECYKNEDGNEIPGKDYITAALEEAYGNISDMYIKELSKSEDGSACHIVLEVKEGAKAREESISILNTGSALLGIRKYWKVIFPFNIKDVTVIGIDGSRVMLDGIHAGDIKDGRLTIPDVIFGERSLSATLPDMGQTGVVKVKVNENTGTIDLKVKPSESFKGSIEGLVYGFCQGWSDYCMTQDPKDIKPYLTDRLFMDYTEDSEWFEGSKYELCQFTAQPRELLLDNMYNIFYTVDEKWHLKEVITDPELVFEDNNKTELEQTQHITWEYHIVNDRGIWKIDSARQLVFEQEIKS